MKKDVHDVAAKIVGMTFVIFIISSIKFLSPIVK